MNLATIVTPSANTEQLLALIALIVFIVAALAAAGTRTFYAALISAAWLFWPAPSCGVDVATDPGLLRSAVGVSLRHTMS
jgi:hypothetical protein